MQALRYQSRDLAEIVELPVPEPGPGEVLIRVEAAGICRTDLEILAGNYSAEFPVTPGHEFAGTVVALGAGAPASWAGRLVAVDPLLPCGACRWCLAGRVNLCANFRAYGSEADGGLAEFAVARVDNLVDATGLPPEIAALAEPLGCAENGAFRSGVGAGDEVLVIGAGPIGLLILTAFGRRGANLSLVEPQAERLARGGAFGAAQRFTSVDEALADTDGYDLVVDVTGRAPVVQQAVRGVRRGGRLLLFGVCPVGSELILDPHDLYAREITVLGSFSLNRTLPAAIESLRTTTAPMADLVTHRLPLDALPEAFSLIGGPTSLKVQVAPHG